MNNIMTLSKIIADLEKEQEKIQRQLECIDKYNRGKDADISLQFKNQFDGEVAFNRSEVKDLLYWKQGELGRKNKGIKKILNAISSIILDRDDLSDAILDTSGIDAYKYLCEQGDGPTNTMKEYLCLIEWAETDVHAKGSLIKQLSFLPRVGMVVCFNDKEESIMIDPDLKGKKDESSDHIVGKVVSVEYWEGTEDAVDKDGNTINIPFTVNIKPDE